MWEMRPNEFAEEMVVWSARDIHAQRGLVFNAATGLLVGGAGKYAKVALQNPAGSGKSLSVYRITVVATSATPVGGSGLGNVVASELLYWPIRVNPSLTGLTARTPGNVKIGGSEGSKAKLHVGVGPDFTDGFASVSGIATMAGTRAAVDTILIIPAGVVFAISTTLGAGAQAVVTLWWVESVPGVAA